MIQEHDINYGTIFWYEICIKHTKFLPILDILSSRLFVEGATVMNYHVVQAFHAVGNGTLFTGQITWGNSYSGPISRFNWIYDCGSTSERVIDTQVKGLPLWFGAGGQDIDMLVLSHFDDDHVNGLETLLDNHVVKKLVLPYIEWAQSIRDISVMGQKGTSPSVALFQLNPARWLEIKNKENRIGEIVLVQGNGGPDDSGSEPGSNFPKDIDWIDDTFPENKMEDNEDDAKYDYEAADSVFMGLGYPMHHSAIKVTRINQEQSISNACKTFEFMFYNAEKSLQGLGLVEEIGGKICAKKSRVPLGKVKTEIENLIMGLGLDGDLRSLPANWRTQLKKCYEKHFGHTAKARNNISLCMYAGPVDTLPFMLCHRHSVMTKGLAILMTGDINLNSWVIDDMKQHFGSERWDNLGVIQVPHHGSRHCWHAGNTRHFMPAIFVQCATGTKHHPHDDVTRELTSHHACILNADRSTPVCIKYDYTYFPHKR
ncbi:MBL fold metallo-hydrolase [Enterobacter adelaidei]